MEKGFTLIELLVVVLIIGILAAIAVPQYQKAVKKARGTEVLRAIDAMDRALTLYYLSHGNYHKNQYDPIEAKDFDIEMPVLKHWKYANASYDREDFVFTEMGFWGGNQLVQYYWVSSTSPLRVEVVWEDGKLQTKECYVPGQSNPSEGCNDFFNCNYVEGTFYPCGAPACPVHQVRCYL